MRLDLTKTELQLTDIYECTLSDGLGTKLYLTPYGGTYVRLPKIGGNEYQAVVISRTKVGTHTDLQLNTMDITLGVDAFTIRGKTILAAKRLGWFENAQVIVSMVDPAQIPEVRLVFKGRIGKGIGSNRKTIKFSINSLDFLNRTIPGVVDQVACNHQLWDPYCRLDKNAYEVTGIGGAGSNQIIIYSPVFSYTIHNSPYYEIGEIKMNTGDNAGISRTVRKHDDGSVEVYDSWDFPVAVGDSFSAYPGCDLSGKTCDEKFSNYLNFLGMEYIPEPSVMY